MDAVGAILAEKEKDNFPWGAGVALALALHLGLVGAFLASSFARPQRLAPPRTVAVRILSSGALRVAAARAAPAAEPAKPRIEKPPEEAPPPPSEKAVLLPAREAKKTPKPTPPPAALTGPRGPDLSLPAAAEGAGGASATAGAGPAAQSALGGLRLEQGEFDHPEYVQRFAMIISMNWFNPVKQMPSSPLLYFRIQRNGAITDVRVVRSSGLPFVDRAALRALEASSPLPPLPADYTGEFLGVTAPFD